MDDVLIVTYCRVEKYTNEQTARLARIAPIAVTDWMNICSEIGIEVCV